VATRKESTKEETTNSVSLYMAGPQVWTSTHIHYKDRDKKKMLAFNSRDFTHYSDFSAAKNSLPSNSVLCLLLQLLYRLYVKQTNSL